MSTNTTNNFFTEREMAKDFLGIGFKFPIQADKMTGKIMTSYYEDDIKESIHIIMKTRKGERIMHPEFGCGIHEYSFAVMDYTSIKIMENEVRAALTMWEPRIIKVDVNIRSDIRDSGLLNIQIGYVVRSTNNPYNLVYPFYLNEGMAKK